MKRSVFVPAFLLVLMVVLCGQAFSMSHPTSYQEPAVGDDHTWGGDQNNSAVPDNHDNLGPYNALETYIAGIFFKWFGLGVTLSKTDIVVDHVVEHQVTTTTPEEPVSRNTGGAQ